MHREFEVHLLNERGINVAQSLVLRFDELLSWLDTVLPEGREFSIVKTKLEEASFFAKKAMAVNKEFQK
jgi:hypothetical protein